MISSNANHRPGHNNKGNCTKNGKQPDHPHHSLLTPPQSTRSSFAALPSTSNSVELSQWISATLKSQGNHFQHINNDYLNQDQDENGSDVELEEGEEEMEEGEDEGDEQMDEDDEDDFEMEEGPDDDQYPRLASLREPSPADTLLFSADDPEHFDALDIEEARQAEAALVNLCSPITSALTQYRTQFNQWELEKDLHHSVINGSSLVDQCLAKFVFTLEPLKWIVEDLFQFGCFLNQFNSFLSKLDNNAQLSREATTQLWNGLSRLDDHSASVEASLSSTSTAMNELCDWVDGQLTPTLAVVKFPAAADNLRVSKILDVHSYLCDSLVKVCTILQLYLSCLDRIKGSIQKFESILSDPDDLGLEFPIQQATTWSSKWAASLTPLVNSLAVLHAISDCIQVHTAGHLTSNLSAGPAPSGDQDCLLLYSDSPLFSFDAKSTPPLNHAISYS